MCDGVAGGPRGGGAGGVPTSLLPAYQPPPPAASGKTELGSSEKNMIGTDIPTCIDRIICD